MLGNPRRRKGLLIGSLVVDLSPPVKMEDSALKMCAF
jgi:hypothetical protein